MDSPTADHDLLIRIETKLDGYILSSNSTLQDHETRIRDVEKSYQRLKGAQWILGGVITIVTIAISVIQIFI